MRRERGERLRERPEDTAGAQRRQPPVVHGDVDYIGVRLQRHLNLPEVVVGIGVLEGEVDDARDDRLQPPRVLHADSARGRERWDEGQHQRPRARVAEDGCLHPRHGKKRS